MQKDFPLTFPPSIPAVRFAKQLNMPNAHVMKFSGLKKTDEYELKDMEVIRSATGATTEKDVSDH